MKNNYCLYSGDTSPSDRFSPWVHGWWFSVDGLGIEKGTLENGNNWLLIGRFYSSDQTGDIISKFCRQGDDSLFRADGEYVLAIYYKDQDAVRIYRDRTGLLPLNYFQDENGNFALSLWLSDLQEAVGEKNPSSVIVEQWPLFRGILPPECLLEGVKVLSGRHILRVSKDGFFLEEAATMVSEGQPYRSLKGASQDLGSHFSRAVQKRIVTGERIGATLSGGNDSSLLVAVLRQGYHGNLKTLFVTFEDYTRNYGKDACRVAEQFNTDHAEIVLTSEDYFNLWAETIYACQAPINHPCTIGQTAAFKILAQEVDVVFSGKGADTVFGGPFWAPFLFLSYTSGLLSKSLRQTIRSLSSRIESEALPAKILSKSMEALGTPLREYIFSEVTFGDKGEVDQVFRSGTWEKTIDECQKFITGDPLADLFFFDVLDWHPVTYDAEKRLCFFHGLTPSYPFLDYELMVNSLRLPVYLRYHLRSKKAALKKYSQNFFDNRFIYKPKEGFGVPLGKWFSEKKYSSFLSLPLEERSLRRGWWNEEELSRIIKTHQAGQGSDHSAEGIPWIVINLELWARICIEGDSPQLYTVK